MAIFDANPWGAFDWLPPPPPQPATSTARIPSRGPSGAVSTIGGAARSRPWGCQRSIVMGGVARVLWCGDRGPHAAGTFALVCRAPSYSFPGVQSRRQAYGTSDRSEDHGA